MKFRVSLVLLICISGNAFGQAALVPLKEQDIKSAIQGKTLEGFYQFEDVMTGEQSYEETYKTDGSLVYKEGDSIDKGKWWISKNQLCHTYNIDVPKIDHCFFIYRENNCFYYYESFYAQTGKMAHAQNWNNRSIIQGEGKTCELLVS